ncbi:MAG: hypothetical protein IJI98_11020 [Methanosphaera sp.]|nr:hypothetical protein [Methanobrevibacter sp.]MBQ6754231.1 hypothetical protein [Bacteroidales bacterium]MBR0351325.1 hypothetical protein [Clostridia bacterium]MBR0473210.1 hypothetical protein [Methanosphaera sp.]
MRSVDNLSLILQALSLEILFRDYNNYDLMQELQNQDTNYLQKIISQNEEILNLLKERSNSDGRKNNK